jgi:ADP-heptose:LPS heptosyltransferase
VPYAYYQHEIHRFLEVVSLVGADAGTLVPRLEVIPADREAAASVLEGLRDPIVVLHPGATDARRHWPASSFAAVADALTGSGATIVITGTESERSVADDVAGRMRGPAVVLTGALSLPGLVGLLQRAALVVSNDTGPRHLAEAVGTATVSIYWCGNLINAGPITRDRHRAHISWQLDCPTCGASGMQDLYPARTGGTACRHRDSWVAQVPVVEVLPDALALLERER